MRELTPLVIVAIPLILGAVDLGLYYLGGNEATISRVLLDISATRRLVALSTAYSLGILLGHLFFPAFAAKAPPAYEVIARMVVVLSPTVYALIIIGVGNGLAAGHERALGGAGQLGLAGYMLAAIVAGGLVGKYVLCQHVLIAS